MGRARGAPGGRRAGDPGPEPVLPELAQGEALGRVSGWGWSLGYLGGLLTLGLCLGYVTWAQAQGQQAQQATAEQLENFKKAFDVCLEAKKYMVKY